jgi:sRNA-binding protein
MAIIDRNAREVGTTLSINLGRAAVDATVCELPFLKK